MALWNARPAAVTQPMAPKSRVKSVSMRFTVAAVLCLCAARWCTSHIPGPVALLAVIAAYAAAALFSLLAVQSLLVSKQSPSWAAELNAGQRKLLGLDAAAARLRPAPAKPSTPVPLLVPPQRGGRTIPTSMLTPSDISAGPAPSPGSRGTAREVTTPEQLRRVLLEFDEQVGSAGGGAAVGGGLAASEYGMFSGHNGAAQPALSPSGTYRPSAVPKGMAATPVRGDGRLTPSSQDQKLAIMKRLHVTQDSLEDGVESLREWFATEVMQPLEHALNTAHLNVLQTAAALGIANISLSPLYQLGANTSAHTTDDDETLKGVRAKVEEALRAPANQGNPQLLNCLQAITTYAKLSSLLRGEFLSGLLPSAHAGYIASRVSDLANGSCMIDFVWNGGGRWNGKPWSADVPTDSALLFYLFASYLAAPQWSFTQEDPSRIEAPGGVLYLGKLPTRVCDEFFTVTSIPPGPHTKATGVLGTQLGAQQPHFTLLLAGERALTQLGQNALLEVLALFVQHVRRSGASIGGRSLEYLKLDQIMQTGRPGILAGALKLRNLFVW